MTADEYRAGLKRLGLNRTEAATLFGVDVRTERRWANYGRAVPRPVVNFLRYLLATNATGSDAVKMIKRSL
jgi:hypothetical protein